jgi:NAD(P)-dependent dehydrogenase (short-subunit alcohol dehydrogenase family)
MNKTMWSNPLPEKSLKDKVILVTGPTSGIGYALSKQAAQLGATIILLGKDVKKLEKVYDEIVQLGGPEPAIHPCNLLKLSPENISDIPFAIEKLFGKLDGLVHNAADINRLAGLEHYPPWVWQSIMQVNLNAPFLLTQALLPLLRKSTASSIVFALDNESIGKAYWGAYSAAKAGLQAFSQMLASELDNTPSIRVNNVSLTQVHTKLRRRVFPAEAVESLMSIDDAAQPFLYLLSDASADITGQTLVVAPETAEV